MSKGILLYSLEFTTIHIFSLYFFIFILLLTVYGYYQHAALKSSNQSELVSTGASSESAVFDFAANRYPKKEILVDYFRFANEDKQFDFL